MIVEVTKSEFSENSETSELLSLNFSGFEFCSLPFSPCIMCVQYIGGCSVHRGMFSTSGVFSTSGGYHEYIRGYHDECRRIP